MSPTYDVKCANPACPEYGTEKVISKGMREHLPGCEQCGGPLQKVYGKGDGAFVLKGGSWAKDGYK